MQLLVFSSIVISALGAPHAYDHYDIIKKDSDIAYGNEATVNGDRLGVSYERSSVGTVSYNQPCTGGRILSASGECVYPIINRSFYRYIAPQRVYNYGPPPTIPKPKLNYNIVFAHTPDSPVPQDPIVVPPAQQQTVVYVLSQKEEPQPTKLIEIPDQPRVPEVYYINYNGYDNPKLPGGFSLDSALKSANKKQGQFINKVNSKTTAKNA